MTDHVTTREWYDSVAQTAASGGLRRGPLARSMP
jgi:hypothetical protein